MREAAVSNEDTEALALDAHPQQEEVKDGRSLRARERLRIPHKIRLAKKSRAVLPGFIRFKREKYLWKCLPNQIKCRLQCILNFLALNHYRNLFAFEA
jgi:hypothetical protein